MDRFLEEQEGVRDRSSSPNNHCLHNAEGGKRHQRSSISSTINETDAKHIDSWASGGGAVDPLADLNNAASQPSAGVNPLTNSLGGSRHIDYTSQSMHETPPGNNASLWVNRSHSNNHEMRNQEGTPLETNEPSSPENILPHLPP